MPFQLAMIKHGGWKHRLLSYHAHFLKLQLQVYLSFTCNFYLQQSSKCVNSGHWVTHWGLRVSVNKVTVFLQTEEWPNKTTLPGRHKSSIHLHITYINSPAKASNTMTFTRIQLSHSTILCFDPKILHFQTCLIKPVLWCQMIKKDATGCKKLLTKNKKKINQLTHDSRHLVICCCWSFHFSLIFIDCLTRSLSMSRVMCVVRVRKQMVKHLNKDVVGMLYCKIYWYVQYQHMCNWSYGLIMKIFVA